MLVFETEIRGEFNYEEEESKAKKLTIEWEEKPVRLDSKAGLSMEMSDLSLSFSGTKRKTLEAKEDYEEHAGSRNQSVEKG